MSTTEENRLIGDLVAASRAARLGVAEDKLRMLARFLVQHGWRKAEPLDPSGLLKGKAMILDQDDPQADPYLVYGYDGFGHQVKLEQAAHHPAAALRRQIDRFAAGSSTSIPGVVRASARYDPIWLCQVLAVHGDGTLFWAETIHPGPDEEER